MYWDQGQFRNVTVTVEQGSDLNIASSPAGRVMTSTIFHINGKLSWLGGDVTVAGAGTSTVVINPTGRFDIISSGKWGSGANYRTQNHGLVEVSLLGTSELGGHYLSNGTTRVIAGTLFHSGNTEQTGGMYELQNGATSKVTGADGLRIFDGGIHGIGKVDGTVKLGYEPGSTDPGAIGAKPFIFAGLYNVRPEVNDVAGTITITGNFEMLSDGASMSATLDKGGGMSLVDVAGAAKLKGSLGLRMHQDYKPAAGTKVAFLKAAAITGDLTESAPWWGPWWDSDKNVMWTLQKGGTEYSIEAKVIEMPPQ